MIKKKSSYFDPHAKYREKMINRIYKGVPDRVRGELWFILLNIGELKKEQSQVYQNMKQIARRHSPDIRQVGHSTYRKEEFSTYLRYQQQVSLKKLQSKQKVKT